MPRVNLYHPLRINLSGFDRVPAEYPAGEQDVPDTVADFLRRNPAAGEVLAADGGVVTEPTIFNRESGPETVIPAPIETDDVDELMDFTRDELNEMAAEVGVSDPDSLPNKMAVAKAILDRTSA